MSKRKKAPPTINDQLSEVKLDQLFADLDKNHGTASELPEELQKEIAAIVASLAYVRDFVDTDDNPSFVGRVFVATDMERTTVNHFILVIDETDTTAFFRRIGAHVSSQSDTHEGREFPSLLAMEDLMKSSCRECERGRNVIKETTLDNSNRPSRIVRSAGVSYREWDGQDCYFDHLW